MSAALQTRPGFFGAKLVTKQQPAARPAAAFAVSARFRGQGTDFAKVPQFQRHDKDSGSPEVQIARLTARVAQLTEHLAEHKKDYSSRRGLLAVLSQRKQMMLYLQRTDKAKYEEVVANLGIRPLKAELTARG